MVAPIENALSSGVMLAAGMHAQPGVYAVLLGSGVSTGAGIPTGWGVVKDLLRQVAAASAPGDATAAEAVDQDPEGWWSARYSGELGYSSLLAALAPTPAARQGILARYFEASEEERAEGVKSPSAAHRAIAQLVAAGTVRVILTTNFDRLMEQALEAAGVSPQVVSRSEAVAGMAPLAHAPATVIKLHGDYKDLDSRNTIDELGAYPEEWRGLLQQVLSEYGLVICGWSADWDRALAEAIEDEPSRRYPLYWDSRSAKGDRARKLLASRAGHVVEAETADSLFTELAESLEALQRLADPPLTTAMAVARLKRYLPDPVRRIDLHDLVMDAAQSVVEHVRRERIRGELTYEQLQGVYEDYLVATDALLRLVVAGVWHDDGTHDALWLDVLTRLGSVRSLPEGTFVTLLDAARLYPALLMLRTAGITATYRGREGLLLRLLNGVEVRDPFREPPRIIAAQALHTHRVLDGEAINRMPRWQKTRWLYPESHFLKEELRPLFEPWIATGADYEGAVHAYEYRVGLVQQLTQHVSGAYGAAPGEYIGERQWARTQEGTTVPSEELAFIRSVGIVQDSAWSSLFSDQEEMDRAIEEYRGTLVRLQRYI